MKSRWVVRTPLLRSSTTLSPKTNATDSVGWKRRIHRARGEILIRCDPTNPAPAEQAFLKAIAVAQSQKARSFELRAALSLAKLYRSCRRDADAHVALGPALEGLSPTPEFPEIAEAIGFVAAVKAAGE